MRKVLLGTTALVAVGLLATGTAYADEEEMMDEEMMEEEMMEPAGPVSVAVGGYYNAAIGTVGGDAGGSDMVHSPSFGQDIEIVVSGSTTLDNGMTVGVSANIEGNKGGDALDERKVYFSGPFGDLSLGSIESARQQTIQWAPGGAGVFGVNSPFFLFAPSSYVTTYDDGLGAEDSLKLVYFTPSFNGFRLGVSYAPSDTEQGQYGGNAVGDSGFSDHTAVSAQYSTDFGGMSLSASVGWETYEAEGMCDSNAKSTPAMDEVTEDVVTQLTDKYTIAQKIAIISAAIDISTPGDYNRDNDGETDGLSALEMWVDKAREVWPGADADNPLISIDTADDATTADSNEERVSVATSPAVAVHDFYTGETSTETMVVTEAMDAMSPNCEPTALNAGLVVSMGGISIGGGMLTKDIANDRESTAYDVGVSYSEGAYTLGLQMASSQSDAIGGGKDETDRYAINATYVLGPGVSIQAQADSGEMTPAGGTGSDWTQVMLGTSISF